MSIKIDKFFVPVDFIVLNMEEDKQIPIILGRPFLATSGTIIDVKLGRITFKIGDDEEEFKLNINEKPLEVNMVCQVDVVDGHLKQPPKVQMKDVGGMDEAFINKGPNKLGEVLLPTTKSCPPISPPKDLRDVPKKKKKKKAKKKIKDKVFEQVMKLIWVIKPPNPSKQVHLRK